MTRAGDTLVLGVDIGTTSMKMGVFRIVDDAPKLIRQFSQEYDVSIYNDGLFGDIEQDKWRKAFAAGCKAMQDIVKDVEVISLSGTTPGLTAMDRNGEALYPAILMLDQRSRKQAKHIIDTVGMERLLETTGNMPVAGGCSLASILWLKENLPEVYEKTFKFGHSNTYIARWLTGAPPRLASADAGAGTFAIDPSSASLTALYNTVRNDFGWNQGIAGALDIPLDRLPQIRPAYESVGRVTASLCAQLGLAKEPVVLIGGNDAVLAAYSVGIKEPGEILNVNGTCEITLVCLDRCIASANYNIRAHVLPDRWLTLHVLNAGGKALDWFRDVFCSEIPAEQFHNEFLPAAIDKWLERDNPVTYVPYLMGSRYSLEPLKAQLLGLTQQSTREQILAAIIRGLCAYQRNHLQEVGRQVQLEHTIHVTGGAVSPALIRAKSRWMRPCRYTCEKQSSMRGAALLALKYLQTGRVR